MASNMIPRFDIDSSRAYDDPDPALWKRFKAGESVDLGLVNPRELTDAEKLDVVRKLSDPAWW